MDRLEHKTVLVTGGARGIGLAVATRLVEEGATVLIADILEETCREAAAELVSKGYQAHAFELDVSSEESWQKLADAIRVQFGGLDGLVNNAGVERTDKVTKMTLSAWQRVMDVNMTGVFLGTKHMTPLLETGTVDGETAASIVNMSSILGLIGFAFNTAYAASKGGVRLFTKSAALEFAEAGQNIRVNSVHPGFVRTHMTEFPAEHLAESGAIDDPESFFQQLADITPMGRIGTTRDIANGVLFLLSDESAFMTGAELVIDGGYTAK